MDLPDPFAMLTRFERYRYAGKRLRFVVYRWIEIYIALSFLASLAAIWISSGALNTTLSFNAWVVIALALIHYGRLLSDAPWLAAAASIEAFVVWAIYQWALSGWIQVQGFGLFCVFLGVARYWQRGEAETTRRAYAAYNAT